MADKIELVDDTVHVPIEDPPPYTPSASGPYAAPSAAGLQPTAPSSAAIGSDDVSPEFMRELRSSQYGAPLSSPHWVPSSPKPTTPNIQQLSMGYDQATTQPVVSQQPESTTSVAVTQSSQTVVVTRPEMPPPSYLWLACLVYWFCNIFAGGFAMLFAMVSANAAYANRMDEAKRYSRYALWTSIAGMGLGIIAVILIAKLFIDHS